MKKIFSGFRENIIYPDSSNFRLIIQRNSYHIDPHWHPCVEIIMPVSLDYQVKIEEETYHLEKGDIMFLHSGTIHALTGPSSGSRLIFQFDVEILYSLKEFQSLLFSFPSFLILRRDLKDPTYTAPAFGHLGIQAQKAPLGSQPLRTGPGALHPSFPFFVPADAGVPRKRDRRSLQPSGKSSLSGKISGGVPVSEPESFLGDHPGNGGILRRFFQISFFQAF